MVRKHGTNDDGRRFTPERVKEVWERAKKISGKDPGLYRLDAMGNEIYKPSYGKNSKKGWEVDHKKPLDKGGTDNLKNLQPLQTKKNKEKSNKYPFKP
ncbi:MAG: HNH endonuclease [bacterium (Candidatus Stahlbacteria) CG23_combo_of_CG06-09_8_20_14_all_34_7]|nr:MAG: HNH endonuclease [bacterium (Candidatus Stahlbacteria) CG23_combo_of_CG06-09_8_20_14_all_34_7]